ncbi:FecR family protein [Candidatus Electronema sp. PJ]|uniref:FecR family protein n=1 Tax=Candidatus Electronema sp. PJ TaxID=3401572 RepID=UPI003AA94FFA
MKLPAAGILVCFLLLCSPSAGRATALQLSEQELLDFFKTETVLPESADAAQGRAQGRGAEAGKVQVMQGTMLVIPQGGSGAYQLQQCLPSVPVYNGDTLITAKDTRAKLLMKDKSILILAAQSKMVIDQAAYSSDEDHRDTQLQLLLGKLRAVVSKMTGDSSFRIKTPTAVAGVRGTDFALAVGPSPHSSTSLMTALVTGGGNSTVVLTGTAGGAVTVGPMSAASAAADQQASPSFQLGQTAWHVLHRIAPEFDQAAAWQQAFLKHEEQCGLNWAVKNALAKGAAPVEILAFIVSKENKLKIRPGLKALYCAGTDRKLVQNAADMLGIAGAETSRAYEESNSECSSGFTW